MRSFAQYLTEATAPINIGAVRKKFEKALARFAKVEGTPGDIAKAIRRLGKQYHFGVSVRKVAELDSGDVSLFGFFDGNLDQEYYKDSSAEPPIELVLIFSSKDKTIPMTQDGIENLARGLAETLAHETIHMHQERKRNWKQIKPKQKYLHKIENIEVGSYLANDDEIEAHALNIAGALLDKFGTKKGAVNYLQKPKPGVLSDHHFDMYIKIFGNGHPVIKRLYKKIIFYLDKRNEV